MALLELLDLGDRYFILVRFLYSKKSWAAISKFGVAVWDRPLVSRFVLYNWA